MVVPVSATTKTGSKSPPDNCSIAKVPHGDEVPIPIPKPAVDGSRFKDVEVEVICEVIISETSKIFVVEVAPPVAAQVKVPEPLV